MKKTKEDVIKHIYNLAGDRKVEREVIDDYEESFLISGQYEGFDGVNDIEIVINESYKGVPGDSGTFGAVYVTLKSSYYPKFYDTASFYYDEFCDVKELAIGIRLRVII